MHSLRELWRRFLQWLILPAVFMGMANTLRRMLFVKRFTVQYPEGRLPQRQGYRGEHRLKKDELGRPKCVGCLMCQTACPARCISIETMQSPWPDRETVPEKFEIDLMKCIYCGMCEEACPCDAIELTPQYNIVSTTRQEKVYDLTKLLNNEFRPSPARLVGISWLEEG